MSLFPSWYFRQSSTVRRCSLSFLLLLSMLVGIAGYTRQGQSQDSGGSDSCDMCWLPSCPPVTKCLDSSKCPGWIDAAVRKAQDQCGDICIPPPPPLTPTDTPTEIPTETPTPSISPTVSVTVTVRPCQTGYFPFQCNSVGFCCFDGAGSPYFCNDGTGAETPGCSDSGPKWSCTGAAGCIPPPTLTVSATPTETPSA